MRITPKDRDIILQKLAEIPLLLWLPKEPTKNQRDHWNLTKKFYAAIREELKTYFAGEESPLATGLQTDYYTTLVLLRTNTYITFYSLVRYSWKIIQHNVQNAETSGFDQYYLRAIKVIHESDSPGSLVAKLLELDCKSHFERCLFYNRFSPRNTYNLIREGERYNRTRRDSSKSTLLKNQKFERDLRQKVKKHPGFFIVATCTRICTIYLDKHNNEILKDYVQAYLKSYLLLTAHQKSFCHPNKKQRPNEWNRGNITFS